MPRSPKEVQRDGAGAGCEGSPGVSAPSRSQALNRPAALGRWAKGARARNSGPWKLLPGLGRNAVYHWYVLSEPNGPGRPACWEYREG